MGVRIFTDAARLSSKGGVNGYQQRSGGGGVLQQALSGNGKMMAIYDGSTGKEGLPPLLDAHVAWMDGSGLYRNGNNFGPTFQNTGAISCVVAGCHAPRNYAYEEVTAARIAELADLWEDLATLAEGDTHAVEGKIFSLFRFTFTATPGGSGCVVALTG